MPVRISIPANHITDPSQPCGIEPFVKSHEICGRRPVAVLANRSHLGRHKISGQITDKPLPIEMQAAHAAINVGDLVKAIISVTPESAPPRPVHRIDSAVFFFQPEMKCRLTKWTMAFPPVFIANMPEAHSRMPAKACSQSTIDGRNFGPIHGGTGAMVVTARLVITVTIRLATPHLWMRQSEPVRLCSTRSRQPHRNPRLMQAIQNVRHPIQIIMSVDRLQSAPSKNAQRDPINTRLREKPKVLLPQTRNILPLLRVIISRMNQSSASENIFHKGLESISGAQSRSIRYMNAFLVRLHPLLNRGAVMNSQIVHNKRDFWPPWQWHRRFPPTTGRQLADPVRKRLAGFCRVKISSNVSRKPGPPPRRGWQEFQVR